MITEMQVVVTAGIVMVVGLIAFTIGLWVGYGREREYVAELEEYEAELQDELAQLRALPPEVAHEVDAAVARHPAGKKRQPSIFQQAMADGTAEVNRSLFELDLEPPLVPTAVIPPEPEASVTAWTRAMAADMDRFITGLISATDEQLRDITR